ncbi:M48 family metallopeptidase [Thermomonospora amylolytica]|uniref:M48 family metallopeptidase n=1 Tax=Thermomonospora amylolytica TaxID=1411117 RepID=UPI000E6BC389|nr:M48 family metallopeptidase [Thermomonospora amylolytica]
MTSALRALLSVTMLAGFYVVAVLQLAAITGVTIWLAVVTNAFVAVKILGPALAVLYASVGAAMWRALRSRPEPPHGVPVAPQQAPALWSLVERLAGEVGTRMPDEIRIVPEVNAAVMEQSRLLGLIGGRRYMYVGLPLLQTMTVAQLASVLAHELGHYSGRHTRLGGVAYRGRLAIGGTISRLGPYNVAGWVFKAYARLYLLVDNAVSRRQEYEADRASVRVAGREVAADALRGLPALDAAWGFFFARYVEPGWENGYVPDDLFAGFAHLVEARRAELAELRAREPEDTGSRWDTHPPVGARIATIMSLPDVPVTPDRRPAGVLIDLAGAGRAVQSAMLDIGDRTVLPWPEYVNAMMTAIVQKEADAIFRRVARILPGHSGPLTLAHVFDIVSGGPQPLRLIGEQLFPEATRREAAALFAGPLETLIRLAALRSGTAFWRLSWTGPAEFVDRSGAPADYEEIAKLAVSSPQGTAEAARRLESMGIVLKSAAQIATTATADGSDVLAGLANIKIDDVEHDVIVLTKGLVLIPDPGKADQGKKRLHQILGSTTPEALAAEYRFLPYEDITDTEVTREVPTRATITLHDGRTLAVQERWNSEFATKNSRDVFLKVLGELRS